MDLFSRKIIGVSMDSHMNIDLVEKALMSAIYRRSPKGEIIHHSDRGSQYTSNSFKQLCELHSIKLSMSEGGCYDNAAMESFFHTLKTELVHLNKFSTRQEDKRAIFEYIEGFYNRKRLHSTLGYLSPEAFEDLYKEKQRICS
jgi:transposase InsO family protein